MKIQEIYKKIEGFENYSVSNLGNVRNDLTGKVLKPCVDKDGYLVVNLYKDKKQYTKRIHRLVAQTFLPNPNKYPAVNHKDENKLNNRVENLEWCTPKYNNNFGTRNKRVSLKNTNGKCSKTVQQYDLNNNFIKEWPSTHEIQRQLGYHQTGICNCCNGKCKAVCGFIWKYK